MGTLRPVAAPHRVTVLLSEADGRCIDINGRERPTDETAIAVLFGEAERRSCRKLS
jgi:hypothetical protein